MNTQFIKTESILWVNFKHAMYAVMVIALAIPLLSYMELSYNNTDNKKEDTVKVQNIASSIVKENTVKL